MVGTPSLARCATADFAHRTASPRRHIHQLFAIKHAPRLGVVEVAFPCRDDDGGHAVADQVAERAAMPMNQSTDSTSTSPIAGMLGTAL
jgi:hypothetical protein